MLKTGGCCWLIFLANIAAYDLTINRFNVDLSACLQNTVSTKSIYLILSTNACLQVHVLRSALMGQPARMQVTVTVSYFRLKEAGAKLVSFGPKESNFCFKRDLRCRFLKQYC